MTKYSIKKYKNIKNLMYQIFFNKKSIKNIQIYENRGMIHLQKILQGSI